MVMRPVLFGVTGAATLLLAFELALRLLPVSTATMTGYHVDPMIIGYPPGHQWVVSTGWDLRNAQRLRANNLGFAADADFGPDPSAIGLIGDSYVEASMLESGSRPATQLAHALRSAGHARPVYGMGGPGSSLLDYAERIRFARQRLTLRDFVVLLEPGDVRQSICGSGNVHAACLDPITFAPRVQRQAEPSAIRRVARHSALAQYIAGQLKVTDPRRLLAQAFQDSQPPVHGIEANAQPSRDVAASQPGLPPDRVRVVQAVADAFFERVATSAQGRLVLLVDGRRSARPGPPSVQMLERDVFVKLASERGAEVIDAERVYATHWEGSTLSLEVGPYDRHLNALGVGLLMKAVASRGPW